MNRLEQAGRVVVKVGSSLIVDEAGQVRGIWMRSLAADIAALRRAGKEVLLVSSGAVALGRQSLGLLDGARARLEDKQAFAACGQAQMVQLWQDAFRRAGAEIKVAQMLLTIDDSENRRRYLNARSTIEALLGFGALPVINENDTVATAELRFGDNDRLAARVAQMAGADCLVLLSDIDGLYTADPRHDASAQFVPEVRGLTPGIEAMAGGSASNVGSGGMVTKLAAAKIALAAGCHMAIAPGQADSPLKALADGGKCTWFLSDATPQGARKHWIAGSLHAAGALTVDDGAAEALRQGKSLLPAGVRTVEGEFERGDGVLIKDAQGRVLGKGLAAYGSADAARIIGRKSQEIEAILGFKGRVALIHRDDLVLES